MKPVNMCVRVSSHKNNGICNFPGAINHPIISRMSREKSARSAFYPSEAINGGDGQKLPGIGSCRRLFLFSATARWNIRMGRVLCQTASSKQREHVLHVNRPEPVHIYRVGYDEVRAESHLALLLNKNNNILYVNVIYTPFEMWHP